MATLPDTTAPDDAPGATVPSGTFTADLATSVWRWSDEIYALHGLAPGQIVPTTGALLAHVHPEDRDGVQQALDQAAGHGIVSTLHRLVATDGSEHVVCLVGQAFTAGPEAKTQLVGHVADVTTSVKRRAAALADTSIRAAARSRADIEQAKAVVAVLLDLDDDAAFGVLRRRSNTTNVPLRSLARQLVQEARTASREDRLSTDWLAAFLSAVPDRA